MGIRSERSTVRILTDDNGNYEKCYPTRNEGLSALLYLTKDIIYKQAILIDPNTAEIIVSLRTIK